MAFVLGMQASGIETRSLRKETRNLKIQDGNEVDVLRRPDQAMFSAILRLVRSDFVDQKQSFTNIEPVTNILCHLI